jgi:hypothetical protein
MRRIPPKQSHVSAAIRRFERLRGDELERHAVDAISQTGGLGPVVEDMSLVALASGAVNLGPRHKEFRISACFHDLGIDRLPEARPACTAIELVFRGKQWKVAPGAMVDPRLVVLMERAGKSPLGVLMAQDTIGSRVKNLFPIFIAFDDFHDWADIRLGGHGSLLEKALHRI